MNMNTYPGKTGPLVTGKAVKCGYLGAWSPNPNLVVGTWVVRFEHALGPEIAARNIFNDVFVG